MLLIFHNFFFTTANQPKTSPNFNFWSIKFAMGYFFFDLTQDGILNGLGITFEKKTEPNLENCSLQRVLIMLLWMLRVRKIGLKMKGSPRLAGPGLVMWPKFRSGLGSPRNLRYGFVKPNLCFSNPYFIKPIFYHTHILTIPYFEVKNMIRIAP